MYTRYPLIGWNITLLTVNIQAQRTNYKYTLHRIYIRRNVHVLLKILNTKKKNIIYDSIPFARVFFLPFKILPRKQRIRNIGNHASFHIRQYFDHNAPRFPFLDRATFLK